MKILNFGSMNIDFVYSVHHIVAPGETIPSQKLEMHAGGKGLNQSVALARAGAPVFHAGCMGEDGNFLLDICKESGVDTRFVRVSDTERTGNAIIQVASNGQNSIVLFPGANRQMTEPFIEEVLAYFEPGDLVLLQNEINLVDVIMKRAHEKGMRVVLNPSPFNDSLLSCPLEDVGIFMLNEVEGAQLTGEEEPARVLAGLHKRFPKALVVLTLGGDGVMCQDGEEVYTHGVFDVNAVDTTAAGDTFTGFFLAAILRGETVPEALRQASTASALAVSVEGATNSIPRLQEVIQADLKLARE